MLKKSLLCFTVVYSCLQIFAQSKIGTDGSRRSLRYTTAFLTISPDSRGSGMGDVGVATPADAFSLNWNVAKLADIEGNVGIAVGYTPWLKKLVNDIHLTYLTGYYRIDNNQVFGASLRYFSLGDITLTDVGGEVVKDFRPHEFSIDGAYSRKLSPDFSIGLAARFIHSNLVGSYNTTSEELHPGNAFAVDLGGYYRKEFRLGDYSSAVSAGLNFSNIGTKVTYSANTKNFLPMTLKIGGGLSLDLDNFNGLGFYVDASKLLVPTPLNKYDETPNGQNTSVITSIFQSFYDAPGVQGSVAKEELQEVMLSAGVEYLYDKKLAIRAGHYYEHENKGGRRYFTMGVGFKLNVFGMDVSYLIPTIPNNPLAHTIRFSLVMDIGAMGDK